MHDTTITEKVFQSLYVNLENDVHSFLARKGVPLDDREDVFHDTMELVWSDRENYSAINGKFSPATFVFLKLRTALRWYFVEKATGSKWGNYESSTVLVRSIEDTISRTSSRMGDESSDNAQDIVFENLGLTEEQDHDSALDSWLILDKMPDDLRAFVIARAVSMKTNSPKHVRRKGKGHKDATCSPTDVVQLMREQGINIRLRTEKLQAPTYQAYEHRLKAFIRNLEETS